MAIEISKKIMPIAGSTSCSFLVNFRIKQVAMNIMLSVRLVALMVFEFAIFVPSQKIIVGPTKTPYATSHEISKSFPLCMCS